MKALQRPHSPSQPPLQALLWLGLAALAARLPLIAFTAGAEFDMESYVRVARGMAEGLRLYGDPSLAGRYPYLPAWALTLWGIAAAFPSALQGRAWIFKLPALLGDLGVTALIYMISARLSFSASGGPGAQARFWQGRPFWLALAWALSPVATLISAGHGQFDSVALCFVLLAAWYLEFSENPNSDLASAISLGFAIAYKTWPLFFLPLFLKAFVTPRERLRYFALSLAFPLLLLLPFLLSCGLEPTVKALSYSGSQAFSLPEALRGFFFGAGASAESYRAAAALWRDLGLFALGLAWLLYALGPWRFPLFAGLAFAVLTLYVFAPGLAAQYLGWLLPFALLLPGRLALRHGFVSLLALLLFYSLFAPGAFLGAATWVPSEKPAWFFTLWALLNLGFWLYLVREWAALGLLCRRPAGRLGFT